MTNEDEESFHRHSSGTITQAKPLKKRWLAHHHVDQEQQLNPSSHQGHIFHFFFK